MKSVNIENQFLQKFLCLVVLVGFANAQAFAGTRDGGGGIGVTCKTEGRPKKVQILDFYESENLRHLQPLSPKPTVSLEILARLQRLATLNSNPADGTWQPTEQIANEIVTRFFRQAQFTTSPLPVTEDATKPILLPECQFEQIAIYASDEKIWINSSLWNALDVRNQAGLILHEYLYEDRRKAGERTSDSARKFIGDLFSSSEMVPKYFDMPAQDILWCYTEGSAADRNVISFYVYYSRGEKRYIANFNQLGPSGILWWRATARIGLAPRLVEIRRLSGDLFHATSSIASVMST